MNLRGQAEGGLATAVKLAEVDRACPPSPDITTREQAHGPLASWATCPSGNGSYLAQKEDEPRKSVYGRMAVARENGRRRIRAHACGAMPSQSTHLSIAAARGLIEAADEAALIELPLNRFVTINWESGGAGDGRYATSAFLRRVQAWCLAGGQQTAYLWVREAGRRIGQHVHILLHVPPVLAAAYLKRQRAWLAQCGLAWGKGNFKGRPIGRSLSRTVGPAGVEASYRTSLMRVVDYMLKEVDQSGRADLAISYTGSGFAVPGKRAGTSENIGQAARDRREGVMRATRIDQLGRLSARPNQPDVPRIVI